MALSCVARVQIQIGASLRTYGEDLDLWHTVVFGGVSDKPQVAELRRGVDALVATPGRLLDLMGRGVVSLDDVELLVLDEADRMLDMGFLPDVRRITKVLPKQRQTMFFSATMPPEVRRLAEGLLDNPIALAIAPVSSTVDSVEQHVFFVEKARKRNLLAQLLREPEVRHTLGGWSFRKSHCTKANR